MYKIHTTLDQLLFLFTMKNIKWNIFFICKFYLGSMYFANVPKFLKFFQKTKQ